MKIFKKINGWGCFISIIYVLAMSVTAAKSFFFVFSPVEKRLFEFASMYTSIGLGRFFLNFQYSLCLKVVFVWFY
jgi:hypothetical protein